MAESQVFKDLVVYALNNRVASAERLGNYRLADHANQQINALMAGLITPAEALEALEREVS